MKKSNSKIRYTALNIKAVQNWLNSISVEKRFVITKNIWSYDGEITDTATKSVYVIRQGSSLVKDNESALGFIIEHDFRYDLIS